jgi:7-cyano-7-deazaguanine synthase
MKVVVIYSGGMDSYTVLHAAVRRGHEVHALTFDYRQRHRREIECTRKVCAELGVPHKVVRVCLDELADHSALTGDMAVPHGHYEEETMKQTVVPNRNMVLLSLAGAYAVNIDADAIWYGAHGGDHAIYPDCRPDFISAVNKALQLGNWHEVSIVAPFSHLDKTGILRIGKSYGLDYADTWTCYEGGEKACGKCGSCQERLEAFTACGMIDPIPYEEN